MFSRPVMVTGHSGLSQVYSDAQKHVKRCSRTSRRSEQHRHQPDQDRYREQQGMELSTTKPPEHQRAHLLHPSQVTGRACQV